MNETYKPKESQKDFLLVCFGRFLVVILALIQVRAVTFYLDLEQYGELAILISLQTFFGLLFINPINQFINLNTHEWWKNGAITQYLGKYRKFLFLVAALGFATAFFVGVRFGRSGIGYALALFLMILAASSNGMLIYLINMLGFRLASIIMAATSAIVALSSSIIFVEYERSAVAWFLGQSVGMFVGTFMALVFLQKNKYQTEIVKKNHPSIDLNSLMKYCIPLAISTGLMWCQFSGYRFMIEKFWGLAALGILSIGMQIPSQISGLIESLVMQFLYPYFYSHVNSEGVRDQIEGPMSDLVNVVFPLYVLVCGGVILGGSYLFKILVDPQFQAASALIGIGALLEFFRMLANLLGNAAHVKSRTDLLALPYLIGASIVFLCLLLMAWMNEEVEIAAISLVIGGAFMFGAIARNVYSNFYIYVNMKIMSASVVFLILATVGSFYLPKFDGLYVNLFALSLVTMPILLAMVLFLRNNVALRRLLSVHLRAS